jgi:hypothetical protein
LGFGFGDGCGVGLGLDEFGLVLLGFGVFGLGWLGLAPSGFPELGAVDPGAGAAPGFSFGFVAPGALEFGELCGFWGVVPGATLLGGVGVPGAALLGGVGVPGVWAPGWPLCPGEAGAVPAGAAPLGAVCATIPDALNNKTESKVAFLSDMMKTPPNRSKSNGSATLFMIDLNRGMKLSGRFPRDIDKLW